MSNGYERRMRRVVDHIHDNPSGDLSLDALADVAALSRFHFHRVYAAIAGETATSTVRRMRLHRAAVALVQGKDPVASIARRVGYPQMASFVRAFSGHYGLTPAAFRKRGELRPFPLQLPMKGPLMFPVTIRTEAPRRLAALAHKGPYQEIGRTYEKLGSTVAARGLMSQVRRMVGVYYDHPAEVKPADLRSHAGFEVGPEFTMSPPLEEVLVPGGRHAVLTYRGPLCRVAGRL